MDRRLKPADWAALALALTLPSAVTWLYFIWLDGAPEGAVKTAFAVGKTVQFLLPAAWVLLVQRQRPRLARPAAWSLGLGALFGLAVGAAMIAFYFAALKPAGFFETVAPLVREKVHAFGVHTFAAYLLLALFYSLIHSLLEEYYWRWFVFGQLADGLCGERPPRRSGLVVALTIASLGFAAHHVLVLGHYFGWTSPLTWLFSASIAIGGAFWSWLYHRFNSLLAPWLSHALIDAAIFLIGYDLITA